MKFTDLLTNPWIDGGATETAGGADAADGGWDGPVEGWFEPALWGVSNGVVLWACCVWSPPE